MKQILLLDGAIGTMLKAKGFEGKWSCEANLKEPLQVVETHKNYLQAGSKILLANTFGASPNNFPKTFEKINCKAIEILKPLLPKNSPLTATISPCSDELGNAELEKNFLKQAKILRTNEVKQIFLETFYNFRQLEIAVRSLKNFSEIEIVPCVVIGKNQKLLSQENLEKVFRLFETEKIKKGGMNCTNGIIFSEETVKNFLQVLEVVVLKPNGQNLNAQTFAKKLFEVAKNGNFWLGGCCETTPDFIEELALFY